MTTIAYSHKLKQIAVDSRATAGTLIADDKCNKVFKRDGLVFIACGSVADLELLTDSYPFGYEGMSDLSASAFVVDDGKVYQCDIQSGKYNVTPIDFDMALGSGCDFALSAMDFGKTPKEAVKYAMTRDCATGGKIQVVKVK